MLLFKKQIEYLQKIFSEKSYSILNLGLKVKGKLNMVLSSFCHDISSFLKNLIETYTFVLLPHINHYLCDVFH